MIPLKLYLCQFRLGADQPGGAVAGVSCSRQPDHNVGAGASASGGRTYKVSE